MSTLADLWPLTAKGRQVRMFVAPRNSPPTLLERTVPHDVLAGIDLLVDDGMSIEKATDMMLAAEKMGPTQHGNAEGMARHILSLRRAVRQLITTRPPHHGGDAPQTRT